MDLVIRGRSQDRTSATTQGGPVCGARQDRTRGRGRTRVVPGRTGPEGMGGPEWFQAGMSRGGPREQEAAVNECTPEGARGAGQSSSSRVAIAEAAPEQASQ